MRILLNSKRIYKTYLDFHQIKSNMRDVAPYIYKIKVHVLDSNINALKYL